MNATLRDELAVLIAEHADPDRTLRDAARSALRALDWACTIRPDFAAQRDALRAAVDTKRGSP